MFKAFLFMPLAFMSFCSGPKTAPPVDGVSGVSNAWPTLAQRLDCLPESGALVAAHRGTSRGSRLAENGRQSLEALIKGGVRLAEIDVAQLRSGEHVLFHDGVWDEKSTGRGPVAGSKWRQVQSYLLKDETGRVTSDTPVLLQDYLRAAKGRVHIEVDFKTSAKYETVISYIKEANMEDDVILIAYSKGQAAKLARLAPNMAISIPIKKLADIKAYKASGVSAKNLYAWVGRGGAGLESRLRDAGVPVLTSSRKADAAKGASILVSDFALRLKPAEGAVGLSPFEQKSYIACLGL